MKNIFLAAMWFALLVTAGALCGCSQKADNEFILKGNISNYPNEMIYFSIGGDKKDSCKVADGKFELRGTLEEPVRLLIADMAYSRNNYNPDMKWINIYIEPEIMNFEMEWFAESENPQRLKKDYTLTNCRTDEESRILDAMIAGAQGKGNYTDSIGAFVLEYPDSYAGVAMLNDYEGIFQLDELKEVYNSMSDKIKLSSDGKSVEKIILAREAIQPGKPVPQFSRMDINGNTFNMADLKGKVVLIDFWASWCKPCRAGMPHIKELYKKYNKKGFEVLCIADNDNDEEKWRNAIETDGTENFIHTLRGFKVNEDGSFDRSNDLSSMFTTHVLPTKFLVGADGNFILTFATDEQLDSTLNEIFGN